MTDDERRKAELDALYSAARDAMAQGFDNLPARKIHISPHPAASIIERHPLVEAGVLDGEAFECARARMQIRGWFEAAKARVRAWTLPDWGRS